MCSWLLPPRQTLTVQPLRLHLTHLHSCQAGLGPWRARPNVEPPGGVSSGPLLQGADAIEPIGGQEGSKGRTPVPAPRSTARHEQEVQQLRRRPCRLL